MRRTQVLIGAIILMTLVACCTFGALEVAFGDDVELADSWVLQFEESLTTPMTLPGPVLEKVMVPESVESTVDQGIVDDDTNRNDGSWIQVFSRTFTTNESFYLDTGGDFRWTATRSGEPSGACVVDAYSTSDLEEGFGAYPDAGLELGSHLGNVNTVVREMHVLPDLYRYDVGLVGGAILTLTIEEWVE